MVITQKQDRIGKAITSDIQASKMVGYESAGIASN